MFGRDAIYRVRINSLRIQRLSIILPIKEFYLDYCEYVNS